jgi:hypothetical protein
LYHWYVEQRSAIDVAKAIGTSRRHCFRLRAAAVRKIVEMGEPSQAA